ncbi:hypothetical protein FBU30_000891 [Linnemannia zychae]|nr:hypothetical protein FBU30_000891 [Linnemannia zychae]
MLFKIANILSAVAFLGAVMAQEPTAEGYNVLHTESVQGGTITWYGDSTAKASASAVESSSMRLNKRCGENHVICYGSHRALGCDYLINYLQSNSGSTMPVSPRAICFKVTPTGQQCCTSWSIAVNGGRYGYLLSAARAINTQCGTPSGTSGLSRDTSIGGTCLTQCLSDRPDGCK